MMKNSVVKIMVGVVVAVGLAALAGCSHSDDAAANNPTQTTSNAAK